MSAKRPCTICRRWFRPHPRAGRRQRVCGSPECQRERHRRACAAWRKRHPDYDREERVRRRLVPAQVEACRELARLVDPLEAVDWAAARRLVGVETSLLVEQSGQLLVGWARDAVRRQVPQVQEDAG